MVEKSILVFRGRPLPRRSANTNMEKEFRQKKKGRTYFFLNMQTYFTFLQGWLRQGPGGNLEKLDKTYVVINRQLHRRFE